MLFVVFKCTRSPSMLNQCFEVKHTNFNKSIKNTFVNFKEFQYWYTIALMGKFQPKCQCQITNFQPKIFHFLYQKSQSKSPQSLPQITSHFRPNIKSSLVLSTVLIKLKVTGGITWFFFTEAETSGTPYSHRTISGHCPKSMHWWQINERTS